ncbi:MAG: TIGR03936 family radical SAM-associated protein [Oscillospiraceae bacterium]|nr:TIGR03936 family radical SAM-associated protein [Oscillospiraceae bacterium]
MRLWLQKSGTAIYTAHLDMNRLLSRAVRRAKLPLRYTEGFNPHPYLTFPLPLPLGQSGEREPVDLRIIGELPDDEIRSAMNAVLPPDVRVVGVTAPIRKASEIAAARYLFTADFAEEAHASAFADYVRGALSADELNAEKRSKRGLQTVNLRDFIRDWAVSQSGACLELLCTLDAGNTRNLNAQLLWKNLADGGGASLNNANITRLGLLCADGTDFQ